MFLDPDVCIEDAANLSRTDEQGDSRNWMQIACVSHSFKCKHVCKLKPAIVRFWHFIYSYILIQHTAGMCAVHDLV